MVNGWALRILEGALRILSRSSDEQRKGQKFTKEAAAAERERERVRERERERANSLYITHLPIARPCGNYW